MIKENIIINNIVFTKKIYKDNEIIVYHKNLFVCNLSQNFNKLLNDRQYIYLWYHSKWEMDNLPISQCMRYNELVDFVRKEIK